MKIPFTLDAWLKDKSQKVETRDGRTARIICTDAKADDGACIIALIPGHGGEEAYQFFPDGRAFSSKSSIEDCADLFLITPGLELSEFEKELERFYNHHLQVCSYDNQGTVEDSLHDGASKLLAVARKELFEEQYTSDPRKTDLYKLGKAEALKDLPRWRKWGNGAAGNSDGHPIALVSGAGGIRFVSVIGITGEKYIMLDDLKKLPGFKEDEK